MKAIWYDRFGDAEVLQYGDRPEPEPQAGEVLIRVRASAVHPSDTTKRAGALKNLLDDGYVIPHSDGAGVIERVGTGVSSGRIGQRVWFYQAQYGRRFGAAAEYVAVESRRAVRLPDAVEFDVGACIGIPAMTAHRCVFSDGDVGGQVILVTGGAGRVGSHAVQWAVRAGARVIATAGSDSDRDKCLELGAASVVNHRDPDWGKQALAANDGKKITRVVEVEFGGNLKTVLDIIADCGVIAAYSSLADMRPAIPFYRMMFKDLTLRMVLVYAMPETAKQRAVAAIDAALMSGVLRCGIVDKYQLSDCAAAHAKIEQGARGCVLVETG